jgi:hypothetical protein
MVSREKPNDLKGFRQLLWMTVNRALAEREGFDQIQRWISHFNNLGMGSSRFVTPQVIHFVTPTSLDFPRPMLECKHLRCTFSAYRPC